MMEVRSFHYAALNLFLVFSPPLLSSGETKISSTRSEKASKQWQFHYRFKMASPTLIQHKNPIQMIRRRGGGGEKKKKKKEMS